MMVFSVLHESVNSEIEIFKPPTSAENISRTDSITAKQLEAGLERYIDVKERKNRKKIRKTP